MLHLRNVDHRCQRFLLGYKNSPEARPELSPTSRKTWWAQLQARRLASFEQRAGLSGLYIILYVVAFFETGISPAPHFGHTESLAMPGFEVREVSWIQNYIYSFHHFSSSFAASQPSLPPRPRPCLEPRQHVTRWFISVAPRLTRPAAFDDANIAGQ